MNIISGFDKLKLLNYPGKVACTIFTKGCNFKCPFCHNSSLIELGNSSYMYDEVFSYLNKRKNILEGVCISGGEPLILKNIKDLGLSIKIDTNGSNPDMLQELIDENLIDYVAMDIKNTFDKYEITTGCKVNIDNIKRSINIIENSNLEYEFRTTIVKELHNKENIKNIVKMLNKKSKYYIQNFVNSDGVLNKNLSGFTKEELVELKNELNYSNIYFRDL